MWRRITSDGHFCEDVNELSVSSRACNFLSTADTVSSKSLLQGLTLKSLFLPVYDKTQLTCAAVGSLLLSFQPTRVLRNNADRWCVQGWSGETERCDVISRISGYTLGPDSTGEEGKLSTVHSWRNGSDHDQKWIMAAEGTFSLPLGSWEGWGVELRKKRKTKLPAASHSHPSGASGSPTEVVCWNGPINLLAPERNFRNWLQTRIQHP